MLLPVILEQTLAEVERNYEQTNLICDIIKNEAKSVKQAPTSTILPTYAIILGKHFGELKCHSTPKVKCHECSYCHCS